MSYQSKSATLEALQQRFGGRSLEELVAHECFERRAQARTHPTIRGIASNHSASQIDALAALLNLSSPEYKLLDLKFFALDSEGFDIQFPNANIRHYLEHHELIDPRTGEEFRRIADVRMQFGVSDHLVSLAQAQ